MFGRYILKRIFNYLNQQKHRPNYSSCSFSNKYNLKSISFQAKRFNQDSSESKCWKCGISRKNALDLFCEKCHSLQNPQETNNYFKVFNIDVSYDVNQKKLTDSYRKMQSVLHPDKYSNKSDMEKQISTEYSSLVNKAYRTLQTPMSRAIHLLHLNEESISEDNKSDNPAFLMEMMELNEEIDEADSPEKIRTLFVKNKDILEKCSEEISNCFGENNIPKAKQAVIKMKYYNSISKRINDLMREKGIVD